MKSYWWSDRRNLFPGCAGSDYMLGRCLSVMAFLAFLLSAARRARKSWEFEQLALTSAFVIAAKTLGNELPYYFFLELRVHKRKRRKRRVGSDQRL